MSSDHMTSIAVVEAVYARLSQRVSEARAVFGRSLTLAEKVLVNHFTQGQLAHITSTSYAQFDVDHVAMQDATAQMALLQFMTAGLDCVAVPTTVHCDHLVRAQHEADADLAAAIAHNREVYEFLRTASARYGIGFWQPGSGIIHQVVLEQYAFPGGMLIGTDSHTPNAGGLGMVAVGVGGADAVDVMVGSPFGLRWPKRIGIELTGELNAWAAPKDIILRVAQLLTVKGATGAIVEYFGDGVHTLSATGRATICNMGAEVGATTSIFPYDERSAAYLRSSGRELIAEAAAGVAHDLCADDDVLREPEQFFDHVLRIDLGALEPQIVGPHTPDLGRAVSQMASETRSNAWPQAPSACLVGSCTNSSYEDLARAASVARAAARAGLSAKVPLYITPGSSRTQKTVERDGLLDDLQAIGATILANACGPCIGQWQRDDVVVGEVNAIVSSYNRNFPKRNDGNPSTLSFIASPEIVVAYAVLGTFEENPLLHHELAPDLRVELPPTGFTEMLEGFLAPPLQSRSVEVSVSPTSERLQLLELFPAWNERDFSQLTVLMKAVGKCTTDHISAAGPWLRYRGHLENICQNLFLGVQNAFSDAPGTGINTLNGEVQSLPDIAKAYREHHVAWAAIGDENYGEGSSREHAAMEPRFMGCKVVFARSFARIHETNLKKQGVLALTFTNPEDYERIGQDDAISVLGVADLAPNRTVQCVVHHPNQQSETFTCTHSMNAEQITWFRAGSALNVIRDRAASAASSHTN